MLYFNNSKLISISSSVKTVNPKNQLQNLVFFHSLQYTVLYNGNSMHFPTFFTLPVHCCKSHHTFLDSSNAGKSMLVQGPDQSYTAM